MISELFSKSGQDNDIRFCLKQAFCLQLVSFLIERDGFSICSYITEYDSWNLD